MLKVRSAAHRGWRTKVRRYKVNCAAVLLAERKW